MRPAGNAGLGFTPTMMVATSINAFPLAILVTPQVAVASVCHGAKPMAHGERSLETDLPPSIGPV